MRLIDADALEKRFEYLATVGNDLVHKVTEEEKGMRTAYHLAKYETHVAPTIAPENPQPQWIPVAERLPEKLVPVLIQHTYMEWAGISIGYITADDYWEWFGYFMGDDMLHRPPVDGLICPGSEYVIAWLPLPEPYKPAGKEENA